MADKKDVFSANDPFDINELASLNDDISAEFIEQLQSQLTAGMSESTTVQKDDADLFEELAQPVISEVTNSEPQPETTPEPQNIDVAATKVALEENFDDNFMKKYKAKMQKQKMGGLAGEKEETPVESQQETPKEESVEKVEPKKGKQNKKAKAPKEIGTLTGGNITETPVNPDMIKYNDSLDFLDDNIKYTKYVIYINPENTEFIESLTVKERKNLINRILRQQDDIAMTQKRFCTIQTIIRHAIVAIITISFSIPIIYYAINASLEASINNYRRSQTMFKTLYKEKGKIKTNSINLN